MPETRPSENSSVTATPSVANAAELCSDHCVPSSDEPAGSVDVEPVDDDDPPSLPHAAAVTRSSPITVTRPR